MSEAPCSTYDPYGGMKTPGQRQLICLQERVKVGEITVDEAVQEFKAWQFDHERRANSLRYQQVDDQQTSLSDSSAINLTFNSSSLKDNLKKLRDSITRRHKEREKTGQEIGEVFGVEMSTSCCVHTTSCWAHGFWCGLLLLCQIMK